MRDLPDDDLWKIETCWRCNVLIVKLHIDIVHLGGYNEIFCTLSTLDAQVLYLSSRICSAPVTSKVFCQFVILAVFATSLTNLIVFDMTKFRIPEKRNFL